MRLILLSLLLCLCCSIASGLDNGLARLPPMGWQSWSKFFCQVDCEADPGNCINEQLYKEMADRMVEDGYLDAGYQFVNIDDCWMAHERTAEGRLAPNGTRFPSGIPALADYIHSKGLLLGIYGDIGNITCEGYPGNWDHLREDAQTYAQWEVDFLKLDGCNSGDGDDWPKLMPGGYMDMSRELNASGRPIVYSCSWPAYLGGPNWTQESLVDYQQIGQHCNLWRNYGDIVAPKGKPTWRVILKIINFFARYQDKFGHAQRAGQWNDPDVILAGNAELSEDQARAQMTIWAMWSAPLLMSNDLRQIPAAHREILLNKRVIAVDQDPLGVMGRLVVNETNAWIFVKEMTPMVEGTQFGTLYSYAFAVLNPENATTTQMAVQLASIGLLNPRGYLLQDLWSGQQLGHFQPSDVFKTSVGPTSAVMVKATLAGLELEGNEVYN